MGERVSESQLALLRRYAIRPVKRRGQNFLLDGNLARAIAVDVCQVATQVLELGAGGGALTGPLLDLGAKVTSVEIDRHLCALLRQELGQRSGFELVETDLGRLDWPQILAQAGPRPVVAGNLPYVLTSVVLFALAEHRDALAGAVLMVQREVAERLTAAPGGRDYGVLAVVLGSVFAVQILRAVPPTVFWPQPEVESAVVRMLPGAAWSAAEYQEFVATVKTLFGQRRKQISAALRRSYGLSTDEVATLAAAVGFLPSDRPEQLEPDVWRRLSRELAARRRP